MVMDLEGARHSTSRAAAVGVAGEVVGVIIGLVRVVIGGDRPQTHELTHLAADGGDPAGVIVVLEGVRDPVADVDHVGPVAATGGDRGSPDANTAGDERRPLLAGHRVLVGSDARAREDLLRVLAGVLPIGQIDEHQVIVRPTADEPEAAAHQGGGQDVGVVPNRLHVGAEVRLERLTECHRLARDDVHQRTTLRAREDGGVEPLHEVGPSERHATARTTEGLVRRGRDVVAERERRQVQAGGNEPREVSHVADQDRTDLVRDGAEGGEVPGARVGRSASHDQLGLLMLGDGADLVEVEEASRVDVVVHRAVELAGGVRRGAMREVAAVAEVEPHQAVTRLERGEVDSGVGLGTGVGLNVHAPAVLGQAEELQGTSTGDVLDRIHVVAAAVVALAGQAFGVLVGEDGADCREHRARHVVLRRDELEVVTLTPLFRCDSRSHFRINQMQETHVSSLQIQVMTGGCQSALVSYLAVKVYRHIAHKSN